jgi:hypothetical protein
MGMVSRGTLLERIETLKARIAEQGPKIAYLERQILCYGEHEVKLDAALAEAREFVEYVEGLCGAKVCTAGDCISVQAREWLRAHSVLKETP